jgi:hypothetical protein
MGVTSVKGRWDREAPAWRGLVRSLEGEMEPIIPFGVGSGGDGRNCVWLAAYVRY